MNSKLHDFGELLNYYSKLSGATPSACTPMDCADMDNDEKKKARRAARFAADAQQPPPPPPKKTFAHPGGKMTSNKEEATAKFLQRAKKHLKKQSSP